jgi:homoserine O-succinyltransferase/O-acetyltransferase
MTISLPAFRRGPRRPAALGIEVALLNLMGDGAFEEAERQFGDLVTRGAGALPVRLSHYAITETPRCDEVAAVVRERYRDVAELDERRLDALVVTGTEPRCANLPEEAIWSRLKMLFRWAEVAGVSIFSSCLASHAALLALDGIERRPLAAKLSGVFAQWVHPHDPLTRGVADVVCPHSRLNEVPVEALQLHGYRVLVGSAEVGWTVAVREGTGLNMLVQGHPEYDPATLLREYRRDVRRFLEGPGAAYPPTPVGYLDAEGVGLLELFKLAATSRGADASLMESFPFQLCAEHICADWKGPMERLVGNWLNEVARRAANGMATAG